MVKGQVTFCFTEEALRSSWLFLSKHLVSLLITADCQLRKSRLLVTAELLYLQGTNISFEGNPHKCRRQTGVSDWASPGEVGGVMSRQSRLTDWRRGGGGGGLAVAETFPTTETQRLLEGKQGDPSQSRVLFITVHGAAEAADVHICIISEHHGKQFSLKWFRGSSGAVGGRSLVRVPT